MKFRKETVWMVAVIGASLALGAVGAEALNYRASSMSNGGQEQHEGGFKYISPLLSCTDLHGLAQLSSLQKELESLISQKKRSGDVGHVSVYIRDLNNGPWLGINENEMFTPASLLKVPLMIAYLKEAEADPAVLDKKIVITDEQQLLPQNIIPQRSVEKGHEYKVAELLEYMIIYSDNLAANALLNNIDTTKLDEVYDDLGVDRPSLEKTENFMMVKDYASFFRILYNSSYLNREMSEKALEILSHSQFNLGLSAGVPAHITVSHKFGERVLTEGKQLHDCGIVYKPEKPYLICIMTRGSEFSKMSTVIQEISAAAYQGIK